MQEQTSNHSHKLSPEAKNLLNKDLLRMLFTSQISINYLEEIFVWEAAPKVIKQNATVTVAALTALKESIKDNVSTRGNKWLDQELSKDKLRDIATIIEDMTKIGAEENEELYEEFLSLVVDLINAVFYAQTNRKNIHFSKYKALFNVIRDELHADTNRQPGQVWYRNGELWLRTSQPEQKTDIQK